MGKSIIKRLSQDYELISATYHEAAHAICGLLYYIKIPAVSVTPAPKNNEDIGFTHYETITDVFGDKAVSEALQLAEINVFYAGLVAEKMHYKNICGSDNFPMMLRSGCSQDILKAAELIKKFDLAPPGEKRYAFKKKIARKLKNLLEEHWDAIRLVAHALYAKKNLNYVDLRDMLIKRSNKKTFWKDRFKQIDFLFDTNKSINAEELRAIILMGP